MVITAMNRDMISIQIPFRQARDLLHFVLSDSVKI